MTSPRPLFPTTPTPNGLTERQQAAWDYVCSVPGGVWATDVGAVLHRLAGKHWQGEWCDYCRQDGFAVLTSKALKPLVIRRRTGLWEPRNPAHRVRQASVQVDELPDDLFGGAA